MGIVVIPAGTSVLSQAQLVRTFKDIFPTSDIFLHSHLISTQAENGDLVLSRHTDGAEIVSDELLEKILLSSDDDVHLFFTHADLKSRMNSLNIIVQTKNNFPNLWGTQEKRITHERALVNLNSREEYSFARVPESFVKMYLPKEVHKSIRLDWNSEKNRLRVEIHFPNSFEGKGKSPRRKFEDDAVASVTKIRENLGFFGIDAFFKLKADLPAVVERMKEHKIAAMV